MRRDREDVKAMICFEAGDMQRDVIGCVSYEIGELIGISTPKEDSYAGKSTKFDSAGNLGQDGDVR